VRLVLVAADEPLAVAWRGVAEQFDWVDVHHGDILALECSAYVSPANSFGHMRGGIDAVYARRFGPSLEATVRAAIALEWGGELPVGEAVVVPTADARVPFMIAAPTMRTPMVLPDGTDHPFLAARAVLRVALAHDELRTVAMPGLGTGVGGVPPDRCADQVLAAIRSVVRVSDRLRIRVERDFGASADHVCDRLASVNVSERIQAAVVLSARGDPARLDHFLREAIVDWRDVLVGAGLADEDWPERLAAELE
jgi:O-acetyl-ADP-ribose deacetylase (regulator of RNase III)